MNNRKNKLQHEKHVHIQTRTFHNNHRSIHQEAIISNTYEHSFKTHEELTELKGKTGKSTTTAEDVNVPFSVS